MAVEVDQVLGEYIPRGLLYHLQVNTFQLQVLHTLEIGQRERHLIQLPVRRTCIPNKILLFFIRCPNLEYSSYVLNETAQIRTFYRPAK